MSDQNFTHKDLAEALGVSETTVKSYRRKFPDCIPIANEGKPIRFSKSALDVAIKIRDYFTTGMSVNEVRARLSEDFSWISKEVSEKKEDNSKNNGMPAISQDVSNMAKSMVNMAQQQKTIVKRMQVIESQLEELGLKGIDVTSEKKSSSVLEDRLNNLDTVTGALAETVNSLASKLDTFLGERAKSAEQWRQQKEQADNAEQSRSSNVVSFQATAKNTVNDSQKEKIDRDIAIEQEPARPFYTLPLVVRASEGQYISVRGRGRFSINDLKALLVYGFEPPSHYTMVWQPHGSGWWLSLEQQQKEEGRTIQILLMELSSQKNGNLIEVLQVKENGVTVHPAEICAIIDGFSG